jgi:hypothetical protein
VEAQLEGLRERERRAVMRKLQREAEELERDGIEDGSGRESFDDDEFEE